jgi:ribosomal protein L16/L10AE
MEAVAMEALARAMRHLALQTQVVVVGALVEVLAL